MVRIRLALGAAAAILLGAAVTKAVGGGTWAAQSASLPGLLASPAIQLTLVNFELLLGAWLLSGYLVRPACLVALSVFLAFAALNLYQGLAGFRSCECFGPLFRISPWYMLPADLGIALVLAWTLRQQQSQSAPQTDSPASAQTLCQTFRVAAIALIALGVAATGAALAATKVDRTRAMLAHMRGDRLTVEPLLFDAGTGEPNQTREAWVDVCNWHREPLTIIGGRNDCACALTRDLPVTIPSGERRRLAITVNYPPSAGTFRRSLTFLTNDAIRPVLSFHVIGQCVSSPELDGSR